MICFAKTVLDRDKYLDELSKIPWDSAYIYDNVDDVCEHWYQLFTDVVDQHMPHKKKVYPRRSATLDHAGNM